MNEATTTAPPSATRLSKPGDTGLRACLRALAYSPHVPFEARSQLQFWTKRRSWESRRPVTFSQKLLWKMAKDRRPLLTTFADKVAVRDYVARVVGPEVLTELYAVVADPADLDPDTLPEQFVVKPNHASGMVWIVEPDAEDTPPGTTRMAPGMFRSTRQAVDWDLVRATCREWLRVDYADCELEWAYRHIPPRIMVEELLADPSGETPIDYKLYVLNGEVRMLEVHMDRFGHRRANLVRPDWTPIDAVLPCDSEPGGPPRPDTLDQMVHLAQALGAETDFVRVDFYDIAGRIVFGELTNYPGALFGPNDPPFSPAAFNLELGGYWAVPARYR